MSVSPQLSPIMGAGHRVDRQQSISPLPQQQLSKRDKRRTQLQDRLNDMNAGFSANRDRHYRNQLQSIQVDINLITNADPHGSHVLKDSPEDIDNLVKEEMRRMMMKSMGEEPPLRAGKIYADFAKEINDAIEEKDAMLSQHKRNFDVKKGEIESHHVYKRKLAYNEHKALASTLRDRLINSVTSKKARLSKDKEALEINNDNSYLLHPSQFGLANPSSPGGIHGKRATRHRREAEELPNLAESSKRKRKAQDSDESPAPSRQRLDNGTSTPVWHAEKHHNTALQFESPLYSIEKLFTEKELSMTYNTAALAAYSFMVRSTQNGDPVDSPPNGKSDASSETGKAATAAADPDAEDADSPPGAVGMERQYSHQTRSTRTYMQTGLGFEVFPDINYPGAMDALSKQIPKLPPMINSLGSRNFSSRTDTIASVSGLPLEEANAEIDLIRRTRAYNDEHGIGANLELELGAKSLLAEAAYYPRNYKKLLDDMACNNYAYIAPNDAKGLLQSNGRGQNIPTSSVRDEIGGHEMAPQLSQASSMGGTSMSRQASGDSITKGKSTGGRRLILNR
ncbi:related to nif-specific regulatory protein [Phialocephala subalpina]|uniref:Related to nif-specific regulatory protein n=1 Tax=Phialocephala subalpina TaxID=576137 RepID=A0A1L7WZE5_9HELO|nr:related to nif-specific regulatory protein [Phialocephala subalpina]